MTDLRGETMRHQELQELCAAQALGALDPPDSARLEAHLRDCEECREEVASHQAVMEALGRSFPQMRPPAAAEQAVMKLAVESRGREESPPSISRPATATAGGMVSRWMLPLAAMLTAGVSLWLAFDASDDVEDLVAENTLLHDAVEQAHESDVDAIAIVAISPDNQGSGWIFLDHNNTDTPDDDVITVHMEGLEPAPDGSSYQAWAIGGKVHRLGTIIPDGAGYEIRRLSLPDLKELEAVEVTMEDSEGVSIPSGKLVFRTQGGFRLVPPADAP